MSDFKNKSMTTKGLELLSKAMTGGKLEFTRIEMGSGTFSGDMSSVENLVEVKQNLQLTNIVRKGGQVTLSAILKIEDIVTEYDWTEIGVYAKGADDVEVLYMYGYTTNSSFISKDSLNEKLINVTVIVSNVAEVTAVIDSSVVYLTREALEDHNTSNTAHNDIRELIKQLEVEIENIDVSWEGITGKPSAFPPSEHGHTASQITGLPTSLPANGGNADTVDGSHGWQMQTLNASGGTHGSASWVAQIQHNKDGDGLFKLFAGDGSIGTKVDNANNATLLKSRDICAEVDSLKSSVVSGKTSVANAINGKLGTSLSNQTSFADMAYYISLLFSFSDISKLFNVTGLLSYQNNRNLPVTVACQILFVSAQSSSHGITWNADRATDALMIYTDFSGYGIRSSTVEIQTTSRTTHIGTSSKFVAFIFPQRINVTVTACTSSGVVGFA